MPRKPRSDSTEELLRIAGGAEKQVAPPSHVPMQDMDWPFWHNVVNEYARADWSEHQLELAAMLARSMADLEENQRLLRAEGVVCERQILDSKGDVKKIISYENVRVRTVNAMMSHVLSMRRSLALHARGKAGGDNRKAGNQRQVGKEVQAQVAKKDRLLA